MRHLLLFIFFCLLMSTQQLYSQDISKMEARYNQLLKEAKTPPPPASSKQKGKKTRTQGHVSANAAPAELKSEAAATAIKIADAYLEEPNYQKAIQYYNNAIKIGTEAGDKAVVARAHAKLADHYGKNGLYNEALTNYASAGKIYKELKNSALYITSLSKAAQLHVGKENYSSAIAAYKEAFNYAKRYQASSVPEISKKLAAVYDKAGDSENADYYRQLDQVSQTTIKEARKEIATYESAKKQEAEIEAERQRLEAILVSAGSSEAIDREAIKKQEAELEKKQRELAAVSANLEKKIQEKMNSKIDSLQNEVGSLNEELEATAAKQRRERETFAIIAGIMLVFILMVSFFYYRIRSINKKLEAKNAEIMQQKKEIEHQKVEIEKEKDKSEQLLLNILPKATADELKDKGFAVPQHYDMVSVLFTDFKGFTMVAEKLSPVEIIKELDVCFLAFDEICDKYKLEKIKTIGDAYMCAGGLPLPNTTNAIDAVLAGLEMQKFMARRKEEKMSTGEPYLELRLGIHTGPVVAGVVGKRKFAYDIWGDTVNMASRMESSGEVNMVNISEATYKLVKDQIYCAYRGEILAKNKGNVAMYFAIEPW